MEPPLHILSRCDNPTGQGSAIPAVPPKAAKVVLGAFPLKVRCSRYSALYPKPPDSDVLPRSGTEMVLFSAQPNKVSYWKGWEQACFKRFGKVRAKEQLIRLSGLHNGFLKSLNFLFQNCISEPISPNLNRNMSLKNKKQSEQKTPFT